jgi:hypothetical protein
MKKIKYTLLVLLFALVVPFTCLAQPSEFGSASLGGNGQASNIGSKEQTAAATNDTNKDYTDATYPIDSNLWVLLLAGCTYMFFKYQKIQKKKKEDTFL